MEQDYIKTILEGMESFLEPVGNLENRRNLLAVSMTRFFNCDSILDFSQAFHRDRERLYSSIDAVTPGRWLHRLRKLGRERFLRFLKKWQHRDASFRSRHSITLCADDFTRNARGSLGKWSGLFYSGAEGGVVEGINIEALVAVIGDGEETIVLDVRIVPPKPLGAGARPLSRNEWLRQAIRRLHSFIVGKGSSLAGCHLSVDAAYVSMENAALVTDLGMTLVGKMSANRRLSGKIGNNIALTAKAGIFSGLSFLLCSERQRILRGEPDVSYVRTVVEAPSLDRPILLIVFVNADQEMASYFSTDLNMKAITMRSIVRYRWQLERLFWILRQDIGIGDIHHHRRNRNETRIYLHFVLAQILRDVAQRHQISPKTILRLIRRKAELLFHEIGFPSTFVHGLSLQGASLLPEAA